MVPIATRMTRKRNSSDRARQLGMMNGERVTALIYYAAGDRATDTLPTARVGLDHTCEPWLDPGFSFPMLAILQVHVSRLEAGFRLVLPRSRLDAVLACSKISLQQHSHEELTDMALVQRPRATVATPNWENATFPAPASKRYGPAQGWILDIVQRGSIQSPLVEREPRVSTTTRTHYRHMLAYHEVSRQGLLNQRRTCWF